jgi:thiamine monophosphate kinase
LGDGEDFELLLAAAPEVAERILAEAPLRSFDVPMTRIGECVAMPGLWQRDASGSATPLAVRGYQHELD